MNYPMRKNILSLLHGRYNRKLFMSYVALIVIPLVIFISFFFSSLSKEANRQAIYTAEKTIVQTTAYLNDQIAAYINIINLISNDNSLQDIIVNRQAYLRESSGNWIIPGERMGNIVYATQNSYLVKNIRLYTLSGKYAFNQSPEYQQLTDEEKLEWDKRFQQIDTLHYLWTSPSFFSSAKLSHLQLYKKIPSTSELFKHIGMISATLPDDTFTKILSEAAFTENTMLVLYNTYGEIIDSHNQSLFGTDDISNLVDLYQPQKDLIQNVSYNSGEYLLGISQIGKTDWSLMLLVPKEDTLAANKLYYYNLTIAVILMFALLIPVCLIASNSLSSGIQSLNNHITNALENHDRTIAMYKSSDEVDELAQKFNELLAQVNDLLDEQYRSGYELKDLELQVLQSQINPHFLYNTLDLIAWLSYDSGDTRIAQVVKELGNFYKLSLGHGEAFVTIRDEINHIKAYTAIQNIRFDNMISLTVRIPEELYSHSILKLLLQPLVENAILHGIRESEKESGNISIEGEKTETCIIIRVNDDGIGMSEEQLQAILSPTTTHSSYAVWNIHERLKLNYGPEYGLKFYSKINEGTTVEISIPV